ncbi:MAG: undecaprenyl-phosphate glucose phosphotransferase, partial [Rhizobiaceae bacterium]|nr:undecaprenyl-phosphate glucose phosphotransferase [Rhizobiaceae bacterium]
MEKHQQFDIDRLRRKVTQGSGGDATSAPEDNGSINALARQVANHLSEENYSPAIIIGQMRLFEFLCLLALG